MQDISSSTAPGFAAIPSDGRILYFGRDRAAFGFLSHFHPARIALDGETWPTVEHFYQAQKSDDPGYRTAIRNAASPSMAKRLAAPPDAPRRVSQQSWFRKHGTLARGANFPQTPPLPRLRLATGTAELIEDSPFEPFWGSGKDGSGENWAGRVLMDVRERSRAEAAG